MFTIIVHFSLDIYAFHFDVVCKNDRIIRAARYIFNSFSSRSCLLQGTHFLIHEKKQTTMDNKQLINKLTRDLSNCDLQRTTDPGANICAVRDQQSFQRHKQLSRMQECSFRVQKQCVNVSVKKAVCGRKGKYRRATKIHTGDT